MGFVAGFTGKALEEGISQSGIETDFVHLEKGCTRINVKIRSGQETDLNGQGPEIDEKALALLYKKLDKIQDGDVLVLAGSIPGSLPPNIYEDILAHLSRKEIKTVVDAAGDLLVNVLKYKPFLVKPNHHELGEIFGKELSSMDEIVNYAKKIRDMGAVNVLISMAQDGAVLVNEFGEVRRCGVCRGTLVSSVGAGDSMVAGFIAGLTKGDYRYALKLGTAAGGATAFSKGLAKKDDIYELLKQLL